MTTDYTFDSSYGVDFRDDGLDWVFDKKLFSDMALRLEGCGLRKNEPKNQGIQPEEARGLLSKSADNQIRLKDIFDNTLKLKS